MRSSSISPNGGQGPQNSVVLGCLLVRLMSALRPAAAVETAAQALQLGLRLLLLAIPLFGAQAKLFRRDEHDLGFFHLKAPATPAASATTKSAMLGLTLEESCPHNRCHQRRYLLSLMISDKLVMRSGSVDGDSGRWIDHVFWAMACVPFDDTFWIASSQLLPS